jgi:hypothetical protein
MGDMYSITRKIGTVLPVLTCVLLCATGCVGMEIPFNRPPTPDASIVFGNEVVGNTRGTLIQGANLPDGAHLGVFAQHTYNQVVVNPSFLNNLRITRSGPGYTYAPACFWPDSGEVKFYAYHPYHAKVHPPLADALSITVDPTKMAFSYTADSIVSKQVDLMFAVTQALNHQEVQFRFTHALTALEFEVKKDSLQNKAVELHALRLRNVKRQGLLSISADTVWTIQGPPCNINVPLNTTPITITTDYKKVTGNDFTLLIPQDTNGMSISLEVVIGGKRKIYDIALKGSRRWYMNERISYKLILSEQLSLVTDASFRNYTPKQL